MAYKPLVEVFEWTHPDMSAPVEVSIGFDSRWAYDGNVDYEIIEPYVEAVYVGNVDIMPLMNMIDIQDALKAYKEQNNG